MDPCPREYRCVECGGTFHSTWSDEEALAEYRANFPGIEDEMVLVCNDCYRRLMTPANLRIMRAADDN